VKSRLYRKTPKDNPKRCSDVFVKIKGLADETVVVVKSIADENMVTYLRVKLLKSDKDVGGEGWNMKLCFRHISINC